MKRKEQVAALQLAVKHLKRQLATARRENGNWEHNYLILQKAARGLADRLDMSETNDAWQVIAERQRIYIKALEERLAGTWNPADTHQQEYDAMYRDRKARH